MFHQSIMFDILYMLHTCTIQPPYMFTVTRVFHVCEVHVSYNMSCYSEEDMHVLCMQ